MILAVDVGNTQTVLGLFGAEDLVGRWRISTEDAATADEVRVKLAGLLAAEGLSWDDVDGAVVASVVPALTVAYERAVQDATGVSPMVVGPGLKTGLPIRYDDPREVGADRIVNALAGMDLCGAPVIVVDFGTATTIDVVDADGAYVGGVIAPGVETSAEALFQAAARLSKVDLEPPAKVIGTNTRHSVQSGLMLGEAAMVDGLVRRCQEELGADCEVVATGGLAQTMSPLCETIGRVEPDLTLHGLMLVHSRNI